ncbi:MAG TPA: hypothetical protein VK622_03075 [Puia sp.]|nr:hypothetical protein [Puia sp.]
MRRCVPDHGHLPPDIQLLIPFANTKIHWNSGITDYQTMADVKVSLNKLYNIMLSEGYVKK